MKLRSVVSRRAPSRTAPAISSIIPRLSIEILRFAGYLVRDPHGFRFGVSVTRPKLSCTLPPAFFAVPAIRFSSMKYSFVVMMCVSNAQHPRFVAHTGSCRGC